MRLIGVGVGPGDPELVTLKAVRVLRTADRVFVPVLDPGEAGRAEATVRAHAGHDRIERLVFALGGARERYWDAAGTRVAGWLAGSGGGTAAFATIGDPNLYSTFAYLARAVAARAPGVLVDTVPGITAMQALGAASGIPLAEGGERLTLLPLAAGVEPIRDVLAADGTVVVYKAGRHLAALAGELQQAGRDAVYGAHLGLAGELVAKLSDVDGVAPYLSTVLVPARRQAYGVER